MEMNTYFHFLVNLNKIRGLLNPSENRNVYKLEFLLPSSVYSDSLEYRKPLKEEATSKAPDLKTFFILKSFRNPVSFSTLPP